MPAGRSSSVIALTFIFKTVEWNGATRMTSPAMETISDAGDKLKSKWTTKAIGLLCLQVFTNTLTDTLRPTENGNQNHETQSHPLPCARFGRRFVRLFHRCPALL